MNDSVPFQSELREWLDRFQSTEGVPERALTLTLAEKKLIVQYEPNGKFLPWKKCEELRKVGRELAKETKTSGYQIGTGIRTVVMGDVKMRLGRSLSGIHTGPIGGVLMGSAFRIRRTLTETFDAEGFGWELVDHLSLFRPKSPPPQCSTKVTSKNRHITVIFEPNL